MGRIFSKVIQQRKASGERVSASSTCPALPSLSLAVLNVDVY